MSFAKARITVEYTGAAIDVMFNPEEYTLNQDNTFASQTVPGLSSPLLQFVHGNLRSLDMELFFDTYEQHRDVRQETQRVVSLLDIDPTLHAPPVLLVSWASLQFRCVLVKASQKFVLFLPDGRPVRARISVSFNEFIDATQEAEAIKRQTSNFSKVHVVVAGETLSAIAAGYYDDPTNWRPIAIENGIDDPRFLAAGWSLVIPPLPFLDPATGEILP